MITQLAVLALLVGETIGGPIGDVKSPGGIAAGGSAGATVTMQDGIKFCLGTDCDYWIEYDNTQLELWSSDSDGAGADALGLSIDDGDLILDLANIVLGNTGLTVGSSTPFSDSSGTLTLQNIDALGATTESTIEAAIDTLGALTLSGALDMGTNSVQIEADDATNATPGYAFTGDTDTGLYRRGADNPAISAGGTAVIHFNTTAVYPFKDLNMGANEIHGSGMLELGAQMSTTHSLTSPDVGVAGALEVDGALWVDSTSTFDGNMAAGNITHKDNTGSAWGTSGDTKMFYLTSDTPDTLRLALSAESRALVITEFADGATAISHALQTNPTFFMHSADATDTTQWGSWAHNQTDVEYGSGKGDHRFNDDGGKGVSTNLRTITESVTFPGGGAATAVTTGSIIPAGAFVVGVSTRTTTTATTCTSVDIGIAAKDTDAFADGTAVAATTTTTTSDGNAGADYSAAGLGIMPSMTAQEITVTAVGGNCVDGVWAISVHYMDVTAATAN